MQVEIIDPNSQVNTSLFKGIIGHVFSGEQKLVEYINVIFMGRDELRTLKNEYFNLDVYTDVISFNLNNEEDSIEGEIYLSFDQIQQNAIQYKTQAQHELHRVLIHGCLHLCGYEDDSEDQKTQMTALEDHYLSKIEDSIR